MPLGIAWRLSRRNILRHRSLSDLFSGTHVVYGIDFNIFGLLDTSGPVLRETDPTSPFSS